MGVIVHKITSGMMVAGFKARQPGEARLTVSRHPT